MRPPTSKRTVVVATDGSEHANYAFRWSMDNVLREDDFVMIIVCHGGKASGGKPYLDLDMHAEPKNDIEAADQSRYRNIIQSYTAELSKRMISAKYAVIKGDAKTALVGKIGDLNADLVIMGSRGASLAKTIMGSVSDYCVHNAPCPVLIVRRPGK